MCIRLRFIGTDFSTRYKVKTLIIDLFFERSKKRAVHFGMSLICGLNAVKNALVVLNLAFTTPRNSAGNNRAHNEIKHEAKCAKDNNSNPDNFEVWLLAGYLLYQTDACSSSHLQKIKLVMQTK